MISTFSSLLFLLAAPEASAWSNNWIDHYDTTPNTEEVYTRVVARSASQLVVGGTFTGSMVIPGCTDTGLSVADCTLTSNGGSDMYLLKYTAGGAYIGARTFGSGNNQWLYDLSTDAAGNIYVIGSTVGSVNFGDASTGAAPGDPSGVVTSSPFGSADWVVAKLSRGGLGIWATSGGSSSYDYPYEVELDSAGNLYVGGVIKGSADFGSLNTGAFGGNGDGVLVKYDTNGVEQWLVSMTGPEYGRVNDIAIGADDEVYVASKFKGTVDYAGTSLTATGVQDFLMSRFDGAGNLTWVQQAEASTRSNVGALVQSGESLFVGGTFKEDLTIDNFTLNASIVGEDNTALLELDKNNGNVMNANHPPDLHIQPADMVFVSTNPATGVRNFAISGNHEVDMVAGSDVLTVEGDLDASVVAFFDDLTSRSGISSTGAGIETAGDLMSVNAFLYLTTGINGASQFGGATFPDTQGTDGMVCRLPKAQF